MTTVSPDDFELFLRASNALKGEPAERVGVVVECLAVGILVEVKKLAGDNERIACGLHAGLVSGVIKQLLAHTKEVNPQGYAVVLASISDTDAVSKLADSITRVVGGEG